MVTFRDDTRPDGSFEAMGWIEFNGTWLAYLQYLYKINPSLVSFNLVKKHNLGAKQIGTHTD